MSTYEYNNGDRRFSADTALMGQCVYVTAQPTSAPMNGMWIPNAHIPTIAAELLKAAGHHYLAGYIEADVDARERAAEAEAAEKELQERRDSLAADLSMSTYSYEHITPIAQNAINRIIELEDAAK